MQVLLGLGGVQGHIAGVQVFRDLLKEFLAFQLAFLVVVAGEKGGDDQVAGEADQVQALVGEGQFLLLEQEGNLVACFDDLLPDAGGGLDAFLDDLLTEDAVGVGCQWKARSGRGSGRPASRRTAGVVQEREGMVLGQGRQPERSFARSTAIGFLSTPYKHLWAISRRA